MKLKITISVFAVVMTVFIIDALNNVGHTNSAGAPAGRTGSPHDAATCATGNCHSGSAVTPVTGWITTNIPAQGYVGGTVYTITATATYTGRSKFGFEVACQSGTGAALGNFIITNAQTQLNLTYVTHTSIGNSGVNSKTWTFNWKAPVAGTGAVTFYGAFNCANGDNTSGGDLIYTSNLAVSELSVVGVDAGVANFTAPVINTCASSITPVVNVKNYGSVAMTTCSVKYSVDNGAPTSFTWNGNLAAGSIAAVTLPATTVSAGLHTIKAYTTNPNNGADAYALDDTASTVFSANGTAPNFTEGFESTTFPPAGWSINNPDNATTWDRVTNAHHSGTACAHMYNYFYSSTGQIDELVSPNINLASALSPYLSFYVAYAMYTGNAPETLSVFISTDCGATWTSIYSKNGTTLQTAAATTNQFVPTLAQWRKDSISLAAYNTFSNVIFKFRNTNEYGNDLYLDDINITSSNVGITDINSSLLNVSAFPNPANNTLNISYTLNKHDDIAIKLFDIYGKQVTTFVNESQEKGEYSSTFDLKDFAPGFYFLRVETLANTETKKVMIIR